jgi:SAM-dependent methyltransferase
MSKLKVNLGCGRVVRKGFVGIDMYDFGQKYVMDFETDPLPFADSTVDHMVASHVLEHIHNLIPLMNEIWRVLKPGAELAVAVPVFPHEEAFQDPTHVRYFVPKTFLYFTKHNPSGGGIGFNGEFEITDMQQEKYEVTCWMKAVKNA